jgi:hypothetical protein
MATLPYSGQISMGDIAAATETPFSYASLSNMSNKTGFDPQHGMLEFYGYSTGWSFLSGYQQYIPTISSQMPSEGYALNSVGLSSFDDGSSGAISNPLPWIMNTSNGLVGYTQFFLSTNGYISFGTGSGSILNTPQQLTYPVTIGGNMGDQWFQPGTSLYDGNQHGLWTRAVSYGDRKQFISIVVFAGKYGQINVPTTYQINLYQDSRFQYIECMVANNASINTGSRMGPYNNNGDVTEITSIASYVWRSPYGGGAWTRLGQGAINGPRLDTNQFLQ